MKRTDALIAS